MKHCVFFLLRLFCCLHVTRVSRFSAISTTWFMVVATLLVAFKSLFVFIRALIGIVNLPPQRKHHLVAFGCFEFLGGSFGSFDGSFVTRLTCCSSGFSRSLGFPFCRSRVFLSAVSIAVANSIAFLNSN